MIASKLDYFYDSRTLSTSDHRQMVMKFMRDQYPNARLERIYSASDHGWYALDFHRCCDNKGWTITIVQTTDGYIFGAFTTAEWESSPTSILKPSPHSFLFSVNEGIKYPITSGDNNSILCRSDFCAVFGTGGNFCDLAIFSYSNNNNSSYCKPNRPSYNLPLASGWFSQKDSSSINGGDKNFKIKEFEVYRVTVIYIFIKSLFQEQ